jgi:hypothetical protein
MTETSPVVLQAEALNSPGMPALLARIGVSPNEDGVVTVDQIVMPPRSVSVEHGCGT